MLLEGPGNFSNEVRSVVNISHRLEEQLGGAGGAKQTPVLSGEESRISEWIPGTGPWFGPQAVRQHGHYAVQEGVPRNIDLADPDASRDFLDRPQPFVICRVYRAAKLLDQCLDRSPPPIEHSRNNGEFGVFAPLIDADRIVAGKGRHQSDLARDTPAIVGEDQSLGIECTATFRRAIKQFIHETPIPAADSRSR